MSFSDKPVNKYYNTSVVSRCIVKFGSLLIDLVQFFFAILVLATSITQRALHTYVSFTARPLDRPLFTEQRLMPE
jgi:hypothetical protein